MAEAAFSQTSPTRRTERRPNGSLSGGLRSVATFLAIFAALFVIWEGAKLIFNIADYNLPHTWAIVGTLFEPVREGGPSLGRILIQAAGFTWAEASLGFVIGSAIGLALAILFWRSGVLQRGLMPFVVASQTVPILAIAPMIVIGFSNLGTPRWMSVSIISAYLSFFPVTINALRGLSSVPATAIELFSSYATTRATLLRKLSLPSALPYIFTALKISATASIVGAIIGELPSGIQDGLGGAILNFNQYYNSAPPRLWATILIASALGILFYSIIAISERLVIRWSPPDVSAA